MYEVLIFRKMLTSIYMYVPSFSRYMLFTPLNIIIYLLFIYVEYKLYFTFNVYYHFEIYITRKYNVLTLLVLFGLFIVDARV